MYVCGYSSEELKLFESVLDAAIAEAAETDVQVSNAVMARRLFDAARNGEREPGRLKAFALAQMPPPAAAGNAATVSFLRIGTRS